MFSSDDYRKAKINMELDMDRLEKIYPNVIKLMSTSTGQQMELKINGKEWFAIKNLLVTLQKEKIIELDNFISGLTL